VAKSGTGARGRAFGDVGHEIGDPWGRKIGNAGYITEKREKVAINRSKRLISI